MEKIKIGAVNYLNTKPLIYGLEHGMMADEVDLIIDYPARIASALLKKEINIALLPVAVIPEMQESYIISDFCIGSKGDVASVCLFSEVPMQNIKKILLDYQSRTSVELLKILLREYWKIDPEFESTTGDFSKEIKNETAGLIIGDRALIQRKNSPFIFDLGEAWFSYTGLPFVFATWVSNRPIDLGFIKRFNIAIEYGLSKVEDVIKENSFTHYDLEVYYNENICYRMDKQMKNGLDLFLSKL